jgi:hypothetical protein
MARRGAHDHDLFARRRRRLAHDDLLGRRPVFDDHCFILRRSNLDYNRQ